MLGPVFAGWGYALALNINFVALPFWLSMVLSALACVLSLAIYEGSGHEIWLEGDEDMEETKVEGRKKDNEDTETASGEGVEDRFKDVVHQKDVDSTLR